MWWRLSFISFIILCGGFVRFVAEIPRVSHEQPEVADAIVVVTGGMGRLEAAGALLRGGAAAQVFVSGVHENVKPKELALIMGLNEQLTECCLILGFAAQTTRGNADEIKQWVTRENINSVLFITNQAHMLRAKTELQHAVPALKILPFAVAHPEINLDKGWIEPKALPTLISEYAKFLFAGIHTMFDLEGTY